MKNNGSALHGGVMVRLGCGLLALVMLLGLLFAGGAFAYADNTAQEMPMLSAVDTANGFCVQVKGASVPADTATLVLKPVSDDVLNYARNGRTLSENEFFLMYQLCFEDNLTHEEVEVTPDGYHITVYFTEKGECFSSVDVAAVGGTLGELETKAANKLAEEAAEAEKAAAEEATAAPAETTAPAEETAAPVEETTAPVAETTAPVAETTAPVEETTAPVAETTAPVAETTAPVAETATPAEETVATAEETAAPAEETTAPAEETTAPAEETPVADRNLKTSEVHIADLYNGNHYVTFNTDGLGILKFTGTSYNVNDLPVEETAEPATLYDRLMACETLDEIYTIMENANEEEAAEMEAFTEEQNAALSEKMDALGAYGVNDLADAVQTGYNGNNMVAYDIMIDRQGQNDRTKLVEIKLNGIDVPHADSTKTYGRYGYYGYTLSDNFPGTGNKLSTYYGTSLNYNDPSENCTLTITPAEGYYVTNVVIPCCNGGTPNQCEVWRNSSTIFSEPFTLDTGRNVSIEIPSSAFGHYTSSNTASRQGILQYFIMVVVAPIPTPTLVEYDYGNIVSLGGDSSIFNDADAWTSVSTGNNYGTTSNPDTNFTQYRYTYEGNNPTNASVWIHNANIVTEAAKENAASLGYYFAGWKATYYMDCEVYTSAGGWGSSSHPGPKTGNTYYYDFKDQYNTVDYAEGQNVPIFSHVQLVAQWKPIELKMTKTVDGLAEITEHASKENTYKLTLQKQNAAGEFETVQADVEYTITGDNTLTYTFGAGLTDTQNVNQVITPGTYKVVETGNYDLTGTTENAYCTTTYPVQTVDVVNDGTVQELKVLNTYNGTPATAEITVKKLISSDSNMLSYNDLFHFTVTGNAKDSDGNKVTEFDLKHGQSKTLTVNVGDSITITEDKGNYSTKYQISAGSVQSGYAAVISPVSGNETITFTNSNSVSIDTGVSLDSLPYILILGVVVVGAVVIVVSRSKHRRDY